MAKNSQKEGAFNLSGVSLPTWRKPGRPRLGQRSLCPERVVCWGWQSPTHEHEEPAAAKRKKILHDLGHGNSKDASFLKFTAAVIKCQYASTYFPIGGGAGSLASGYGDFVGVDSQAGEEEADMESVERFRLSIKRGMWIKMSNALIGHERQRWWEVFKAVNMIFAAAATRHCPS